MYALLQGWTIKEIKFLKFPSLFFLYINFSFSICASSFLQFFFVDRCRSQDFATDWGDKRVVDALDRYRRKEIATLSAPRQTLHAMTGALVSEMTLSRRLSGKRTLNSGGRLPKRPLAQVNSEIDFEVSF